MSLAPPAGFTQRCRGAGQSQSDLGNAFRTSDSLLGFGEASIVGGRRNLYLLVCPSLHCPWEDGVMLGRIIGLVLVAVAVSATASAQGQHCSHWTFPMRRKKKSGRTRFAGTT